MVHNSTILNANKYREKILATGQKFQSATDSKIALRMLSLETGSLVGKLKKVYQKLKGDFSFVLIIKKELKGKSFMLASETFTLEANEFKYLREIQPEEIVVIEKKDVKSFKMKNHMKITPCIFELVYFS